MKKLLPVIPAVLLCGCQFYQPGNIGQKVFGGLGSDDSILSVPTPYGRAIRISGTSSNNVVVHPDGTISKSQACPKCGEKPKPQAMFQEGGSTTLGIPDSWHIDPEQWGSTTLNLGELTAEDYTRISRFGN
jgi:hypothetical protein